MKNLKKDRTVEYGFALKQLPIVEKNNKTLLDIGCIGGQFPWLAASKGYQVTCIDQRTDLKFIKSKEFDFYKADIMKNDISEFGEFDYITLISTIEHIGLSGRYNSIENPDGDLIIMQSLIRFLRKDAVVILTLPIGQEHIMKPHHRVYGENRLNNLLNGYIQIYSEYYIKDDNNEWVQAQRHVAMNEEPTLNPSYYALGCFVLKRFDL